MTRRKPAKPPAAAKGPAKKKSPPSPPPASHPAFERERLLHELSVQQVELERQNGELREARHRLEASRDRYAELYDFAPVGYVTLDGKGLIQEINLTAAKMLGVERAALLHQPLLPHVLPADRPAFTAHFGKLARADGPVVTEVDLQVQGDGILPVELRSVAVLAAGRPTRQSRSTLTDISARRQTDRVLRASHDFNHDILSSLDAQIAVLDQSGTIIAVNESWSRFARENGGVPERIGVGMNYAAVCREAGGPSGAEAPAVIAGIQAVLAHTQASFILEYPCNAPGVARWFQISVTALSGNVGGAVVAHLDITGRRLAEATTVEQESRMRAILESAAEGIITIDEQGVIESFNSAAERVFGYPAMKVIGRNVKFLMPGPDRRKHDSYLAHYCATGERNVIGRDREVTGRRADGSIFPMELSVSEVPLADRRLFTGFVRDISARREAEMALRVSEERLTYALEAVSDGLWDWNLQTGVVYYSPRWLQAMGYSLAEVPPSVDFWKSILHPEDSERVMAALDAHLARQTPRYECENRLRLQSGEYRWHLNRGRVVEWTAEGAPLRMVGVDADITDRKQAQDALRFSEARYQTLFNTLIEGFCVIEVVFDAQDRPVDYRFLEVNPAFEAQSGLVGAAGRLMREFAPDLETHWFEMYGRVARTGEPVRFVNEARALNRWFDVSAFRFGGAESRKVAVLFNDITERKRAEAAVVEYEQRFRNFVDTAPTIAWLKDAAGRYVYVNRTFEVRFGLQASDCCGKTEFELWPRDQAERSHKHFQAVLAGGQRIEVIDEQPDASGNSTVWWKFKFLIQDAAGRRFVGGIGIDITERRRAEEMLVASERRERERAAELAALLDAVPTPVFVAHDPDCLHISGNRVAEEMLRLPRGTEASLSAPVATRPRHFWALRNGRELATDELPAQRAARGFPVQDFDFSLVFDDGTTLEMLAYSTPLWDEQGRPRGAINVLVDVTERKRAEAALRAREAQLHSFVQQAPVAMAMFDRQMNYLATSQRWRITFSRGEADLYGRNYYAVHPDIPELWKEIHQQGLAGESNSSEEELWTQADGTQMWLRWAVVPWLDETGAIGGILIMAADITIRKRAIDSLRLKEASLAETQAIAHVGSYELHVGPFVLGGWSAETFRIMGRNPAADHPSSEEYLGRIVHPADRERVRHAVAVAIQAGRGFSLEYRIRRPDGTIRHVHSMAEAVFGTDGQVVKFVGSMQDITERLTLENEILEISEREQNRFGQDLHDGLCQHLAGIEFRMQALRQELERDALAPAAEAGELARLLREGIEQTRSLARGLSPVMLGPEGLMDALQQLVEGVGQTFRIACSLHCPTPVMVYDNTVATHLYRITQEAIHNAIRHGHARSVGVDLAVRDDRIVLGIRDDGVGLPRTPQKHRGMGLRVMQYRASLLHGSLVVQAPPEGGTAIVCILPMSVAPSPIDPADSGPEDQTG